MTTEAPQRPYNLRPSLQWVSHPEERASAHPFAAATLPRRFVFGEDEPIDDQLQLGGCTANMIDEVLHYLQEMLGLTPIQISRLWQYWQERNREGTTATDAGATIADTVWVAQNLGFFDESVYPYIIQQFASTPPPSLLARAASNKGLIKSTMLQTDVATLKTFMWNGDGTHPLPIAYGFAVYQQYETVGANGLIAMPTGAALGGHANSRWGWDDDMMMPGWPAPGAWRIHNVWGNSAWGDKGRGWLPYSYPTWDVWGVGPAKAPTPPPTPTPTHVTMMRVDTTTQQLLDGSLSATVQAQDAVSGKFYKLTGPLTLVP